MNLALLNHITCDLFMVVPLTLLCQKAALVFISILFHASLFSTQGWFVQCRGLCVWCGNSSTVIVGNVRACCCNTAHWTYPDCVPSRKSVHTSILQSYPTAPVVPSCSCCCSCLLDARFVTPKGQEANERDEELARLNEKVR